MPWDIRKDFHLDVRAGYGRVLVSSATDSSLLQPPPDMVAGDSLPVRLYFWERGPAGSLTAADPGAGSSLVFSGRPAGAPSGSELLFQTGNFVQVSDGVWEGTLDLATAEMTAHLAAVPVGAKTILGEIEVRDSLANTRRVSLQFDLTARPQVYDNEDAPTALPGPEAWLTAQLADRGIPDSGKASLAGGNTFSGTQIMTGQLSLTGQTVLSDASAMTRGLSEQYFGWRKRAADRLATQAFGPRVFYPTSGNTSGAGGAGPSDHGSYAMQSSTTASAWQRCAISRMLVDDPGSTGSNGSAATPFVVGTLAYLYLSTSGGTDFRLVMGDAGSGAPPAGSPYLSGRGFGVRIFYNAGYLSYQLFAHDGAVVFLGPVSLMPAGPSGNQPWNLGLGTDGLGGISFYVGAPTPADVVPPSKWGFVDAISGGPQSGSYGGPYFSALLVNGATAPAIASSCKVMQARLNLYP